MYRPRPSLVSLVLARGQCPQAVWPPVALRSCTPFPLASLAWQTPKPRPPSPSPWQNPYLLTLPSRSKVSSPAPRGQSTETTPRFAIPSHPIPSHPILFARTTQPGVAENRKEKYGLCPSTGGEELPEGKTHATLTYQDGGRVKRGRRRRSPRILRVLDLDRNRGV